jgi:hypothetical protein
MEVIYVWECVCRSRFNITGYHETKVFTPLAESSIRMVFVPTWERRNEQRLKAGYDAPAS